MQQQAKRRTKTNNLHDAIPHPTSLPYPTFYTTFKATLYAARRTPTRRIRTSADVEGRLGLRYSPYKEASEWMYFYNLLNALA